MASSAGKNKLCDWSVHIDKELGEKSVQHRIVWERLNSLISLNTRQLE